MNFFLGTITGKLYDKGYLYVLRNLVRCDHLTVFSSYLLTATLVLNSLGRTLFHLLLQKTSAQYVASIHAIINERELILPSQHSFPSLDFRSFYVAQVFLTHGVMLGLATGISYVASMHSRDADFYFRVDDNCLQVWVSRRTTL